MEKETVGVIGAGSFGGTIAGLLAKNRDVLLYTRSEEKAEYINAHHRLGEWELDKRITATADGHEICERCKVLFPVLPSIVFSETIRQFSPWLRPSHMLIHGTKGLDLRNISDEELLEKEISRNDVRTMSEVILEESNVVRVGCLSGPNLAREIQEGQPTATVVASSYDEVISTGERLLSSQKFFVFGSHDLIGAELAGAFKNIIAIGSGILEGLGMGRNLQAMLIVRSLREIIHLGKSLGSTSRAFLGTAGIGDIIATSLSEKSRNFSAGLQLARGKNLQEVLNDMDEVAEGIRTLKIAYYLAKHYRIRVPVINGLYGVVYQSEDIERTIQFLMRYPFSQDVDFL